MKNLITIVSSGKGTWKEVATLLNKGEWEKVYLVCNDFTHDKFTVENKNVEKIKIDDKDFNKSIENLTKTFQGIEEMEVALNITSGDGTEHMMIIQAILKAGLSFKFVRAIEGRLKVMDVISNKIIQDYENLI